MPTADTLLVFTFAALALILVPGPGMVLLLARGVAFGRRAAVFSSLGLETGTGVYVAATATGLSALLASSAVAFAFVRYLGAVYLVVLGVRTLAGGSKGTVDHAPYQPTPAELLPGRAYRQALLVGITNPKIAIFFVAFFPQFIDPHRGAAAGQVLVLGAVFVTLALAVDLLVATTAGTVGGWLARRPSLARRQRHVTASIYLALGAAAAGGPGRG
jgi:threonine/homoserine/homoserine lactone efflux protein